MYPDSEYDVIVLGGGPAGSTAAALTAAGARRRRHGPEFVAGIDALRKLVYAYYDPDFSIAQFLEQYPEQQENPVHLLIGNVCRTNVEGLLRAMDEYRELPKYEPIQVEEATVLTSS